MNVLAQLSQSLTLVSRSVTAVAQVSGIVAPESWLTNSLGGLSMIGAQSSGVPVTSKSIQQIPYYISGLRLLSETLGSLSGKMIRETEDSIDYLKSDPRFRLAFRQPSPAMTAPVFWETAMKYAVHKGNAFAYLRRNERFEVEEILFIHEKYQVNVYEIQGRLWYRIPMLSEELIPDYDMLHFKGLGDGYVGIGAIEYAATTAGIALGGYRNQAKFYKDGSQLQGYISHPKPLKKETIDRLRESWHKVYHNSEGSANSVAFLDEGMDFKSISVTPEQAKYLDSLKNAGYEISAILRVPPHMIALMDKSSFNNIEHQSIDFVKFSLLPWIHRFEAELASKLLTEREKEADEIKFKFNVETLLRGTYKDRMEGYRVAINIGLMSQNEARKLESMAPYPGGDRRWIQMNMMPVDAADDILNRAADQLALLNLKSSNSDGKSTD